MAQSVGVATVLASVLILVTVLLLVALTSRKTLSSFHFCTEPSYLLARVALLGWNTIGIAVACDPFIGRYVQPSERTVRD